MNDKLPSVETIITQTVAKAEATQDIFRHVMQNKEMTRTEILDYILAESESLVLLAEQLLSALEREQAAKIAGINKFIAAVEKAAQDAQKQQVTEADKSEDKA
jgi:phosphomevalonate kinase